MYQSIGEDIFFMITVDLFVLHNRLLYLYFVPLIIHLSIYLNQGKVNQRGFKTCVTFLYRIEIAARELACKKYLDINIYIFSTKIH